MFQNVSGKFSATRATQKLLDSVKKSEVTKVVTDVLNTEATGDLIDNKISDELGKSYSDDKITASSHNVPETN